MVYSRATASGTDVDTGQLIVSMVAAGVSWLRNPNEEMRRTLESAINEVQCSSALKTLLAVEVDRLAGDFSYTPERVAAGRVALYEDQECRLDLYALPAGEAEATTFLYSDVSSVVRIPFDIQAKITVSSYSAPAVRRNDVFVPTAKLTRDAPSQLVGSVHAVRVSSQHLTVHEFRSDRATVLACIALKSALPFVWGFERASLVARLLYPSDLSASRTALAVDFLKSNAHPRLPELCTALLGSPWHFLRWKATQLMAEMETAPLDELLTRASVDEHPDIRATALRVLRDLNQPDSHANQDRAG